MLPSSQVSNKSHMNIYRGPISATPNLDDVLVDPYIQNYLFTQMALKILIALRQYGIRIFSQNQFCQQQLLLLFTSNKPKLIDLLRCFIFSQTCPLLSTSSAAKWSPSASQLFAYFERQLVLLLIYDMTCKN